MDTKKADSSVVMALSELVQMEHARIESDREREEARIAERERLAAMAKEAERQRAESAAQQARVAEAEARLRVEADRERDQRIAAMRAELARVESERLTLRANLEQRVMAPPPSRPSGWALAFGLSSLVAASLAGLLVMQQSHELPISAAPVASAPVFVAAPHGQDVVAVAPAVEPVIEVAPVAAPIVAVRGRRRRPDHVETTTGHGTELIGLGEDDGGDDVLGPELVRDAHRTLQH